MPKLLQINTVVNSGSTGHIAEDLGLFAIENGWQSIIAYGRNSQPSSSELIRIGTDHDVKLHGIQTRLFDRHGLGSKTSTEKLTKQIEIINPDIIHLHNIHGYYLNIEVLFNFLAKANVPIVWTLHDCWAFTGHCSHFEAVNCERWKDYCHHCPQKKEYPASYVFDRSEKNFELKRKLFNSVKTMTLVPVSQWLGNVVKESILSKFPINIIHNGIDPKIFNHEVSSNLKQNPIFKDKFIILGVANTWTKRKGLSDFIELSKKLNSEFVIVLIGLSQKQIDSLPRKIIGIKRTENINELVEYYSLADVFVNPSWEESLSMTNLEAQSCGTPVITYNAGGTSETVSADTGFVIEKGDIAGLQTAIYTCQMKGKNEFSLHCKLWIDRLFNKQERLKDYLQLYQQL